MAITLSSNTYAGQALQDIVTAAVLRGGLLEQGAITVHTDIRKKMVVPTLAAAATIQDGAGTFNAAGTLTGDETVLEPLARMINIEVDASVLAGWWTSLQQRAGSAGRFELVDPVTDAVIEELGGIVGKFNSYLIWQGSAAAGNDSAITVTGSNTTDGLISDLQADADVNDITPNASKQAISAASEADPAVLTLSASHGVQVGDWVTLNNLAGGTWNTEDGNSYQVTAVSGNDITLGALDSSGLGTWSSGNIVSINRDTVIDELQQFYALQGEQVETQEDYYIYVPTHVAKAYYAEQANAATGAGRFTVGARELDFLGNKMIADPFMSKNTIVGSRVRDLHFGTALVEDFTSFSIHNLAETSGNRKYQIRMDFTADVAHTNGKDISLYDPAL